MQRSLALTGEAGDVPRARRFVADALRGTAGEAVTSNAQLVMTELATNAILHGAPPIEVAVIVHDQSVRLEVTDGSRRTPFKGFGTDDSMTGRGLALVEQVVGRWGVALAADGKSVWAEFPLTEEPTGSRAQVSDSDGRRDPDDDAEVVVEDGLRRFVISLGDVPTDLLLAAKAHIDNLVREFTLARSGARSGSSAPLSEPLERLIDVVTNGFAEARREIKRQAVAAAGAGKKRTSLVLTLPVEAANAGREYLTALDAADQYARASRLLTVESPPQHRAFRQWYVRALIEQLEAIGRGEPPPAPPTFEQHLLAEFGVVSQAQVLADRAMRLQAVTASLASAVTTADVAQVVVSEGVSALGASGGALLVPLEGQRFGVPGNVGYDAELVELLKAEPLDAQLPAAEALRSGEAVWIESREERDRLFPSMRGFEPTTISMCAMPLVLGDRVMGALRFSFDAPRLFDADERRFVLALAGQTAQAVERAELYHAQELARFDAETAVHRLGRLHHISASLAGANNVEEITEIVTVQGAHALGARLSALTLMVDDDTLRTVGLHGARPGTLEAWTTFRLDANLPASLAVRSNQPVVIPTRAEVESRFPALTGHIASEGALACVPLTAGGRRLGALAVTFPADHVVDQAEVDLIMTIGRQCALALERAGLIERERQARQRASFVADATSLLSSSLEPDETLRHLTSLLVPSLADWCVVYLTEARGTATTADAAHRDPMVAQFMREQQRGRPLDPARPGLGDVIRTGASLRYERVPEELTRPIAENIEDPDLVSALLPLTALAVPLKVRGQVLGALAMARTSGDSYTVEDLQLAEDLASRAAVAVDNAEQFRRERDAALTLQRSLLPQRLPSIGGLSFAWRYLPGAAGTQIGGDWYDVIPLDASHVALVIGDVMGRGLRAAAVMGQLRATVRAHASAQLGPAEVLGQLDRAVGRLEQEQITTALIAVLNTDDLTLTVASAGHLAPLLSSEGGADFLDVEPGPPLGVGLDNYRGTHFRLPEPSTLFLFTDGLVEDRAMPVDKGLAVLRQAVAGVTDPETLCDRALSALGRDTEHDDDTAILAVGVRHPHA